MSATTWALWHLQRARALRARLERATRGTPDYGDLNYQRHQAIEQAKQHIAALASPITAELADLIAAEVPS